MTVNIQFQLDPELKLTDNVRRALEQDIKVLVDSYSSRDAAIISYHEHIDGPITTLGEMDDQMYTEADKNIAKREAEYNRTGFDDITEEEYNTLFQQDYKDQNDEVDKDTNERSEFYKSDRPVDP